MSDNEIQSWVLVTSLKNGIEPSKIAEISPQVSELVDAWHSKGKIMLSGPFDNGISSMAVFEATQTEAREFFKKYEKICAELLTFELYQWEVPPILSVISN